MKSLKLIAALGVFAASPALADHHQGNEEEEAPMAEVVERDEEGRATRIRVEGYEYDVCSEGQQDNCINPREAGLDFGTVPIDHWPGRPASQMESDEQASDDEEDEG